MADKKKKEFDPNEIDASFVISSFKNKERLNNPSSVPRPLLSPEEKEEETTARPETLREENKRRRSKSPDYESLFIQEVDITARKGKSVYIRQEHHDKITKIIQVIGKNKVSLFSYIDNVLTHHLATYQDEITELYDKNNKSIF